MCFVYMEHICNVRLGFYNQHQNVIRCYLFESWKLNEPKVVLKLGNLRSQSDQYESLLLGQK